MKVYISLINKENCKTPVNPLLKQLSFLSFILLAPMHAIIFLVTHPSRFFFWIFSEIFCLANKVFWFFSFRSWTINSFILFSVSRILTAFFWYNGFLKTFLFNKIIEITILVSGYILWNVLSKVFFRNHYEKKFFELYLPFHHEFPQKDFFSLDCFLSSHFLCFSFLGLSANWAKSRTNAWSTTTTGTTATTATCFLKNLTSFSFLYLCSILLYLRFHAAILPLWWCWYHNY